MDIYNIYNFIKNISETQSSIKQKLICLDPLINLNLEYSSRLSGGATKHVVPVVSAPVAPVPAAAPVAPAPAAAPVVAAGEEKKNKIPDDNFKKVLKKCIKYIIMIFFIFLLPLAPFIAISYYSFKKVKSLYNNDIYTL